MSSHVESDNGDGDKCPLSSAVVDLSQTLELFKDELVLPYAQFADYLKATSLSIIVGGRGKASSDSDECMNGDEGGSGDPNHLLWKPVADRVAYLRSVLRIAKLFPFGCGNGNNIASKLLHTCATLMGGAYEFQKRLCRGDDVGPRFRNEGATEDSDGLNLRRNYSELILQPLISLVDDCLESAGEWVQHPSASKNVSKIFNDSLTFLSTPSGVSLSRPDFLRLLGLCQRLQKLIKNDAIDSPPMLDSHVIDILSSENGRSLLKFCCEINSSRGGGGEGKMPHFLESIARLGGAGATNLPQLYMVLATYLEDSWFWGTEVGKTLTPLLIANIRQDLGSSDKAKTDCQKRAAFVLKVITEQYASGNPLFDPALPEVDWISLDNTKDMKMYRRFWTCFFDLFEILNEPQLHIVQPVLEKFNIFQEYSSNPAIFMWLPILLTKAIRHDNRTIVMEGLDRFLQTGQYIEAGGGNESYRELAINFLEEQVMTVIKDHVGWVLKEPEDFFQTVSSFGQFLVSLYSHSGIPNFLAADKILTFLTSSGKCMSSHTVYFLISALDEAMHSGKVSQHSSDNAHLVTTKMIQCMELLANLLSNSVTNVSKLFRELLETHCVNILSRLMEYLPFFDKIDLDSPIFSKLLAFLASLSGKTVYTNQGSREKLKYVVESYNGKLGLRQKVISGSNSLYDFAQSKSSVSVSALGIFRFLTISTMGAEKCIMSEVEPCIGKFAEESVRTGILKGSLEGLREFYHHYNKDNLVVSPTVYFAMMGEVLEKTGNNPWERLPSDDFHFCIRCLEVVKSVQGGASNLVSPPDIGCLTGPGTMKRDPLTRFVLRKFIKCMGEGGCSELVKGDMFHAEASSDTLESCEGIHEIAADYFQSFDRNLFAEFYQLEFEVSLMQQRLGVHLPLSIISFVLNAIEKCSQNGVAAGLRLIKCVIGEHVYSKSSDIATELEKLASVGWRLIFDNRKNETFWLGYEALVDFIICPHFLNTGILNKYADLIFEHGETIPGLTFVFVQALVKVDFPHEMMHESHEILLKASLSGAAVPKNNRVSFAMWDYLRKDANCGFEDPENFSSDCKARLLAVERIRRDLNFMLTTDEFRSTGEELLRLHIVFLLERNKEESKYRQRYFGGSLTHRTKQRILQILLILQPYFNQETSELALDSVMESLTMDSPQPSARYMGEWILTLIIQRYPSLGEKFLRRSLNECIRNRVGYGAFFSTICLHISTHLKSLEFYDGALQALLTLTLSQHLTVRVYAQVAFQKIYERAQDYQYQSVIDKYAPALTALQGALAHVSGNCSKLLHNVAQDFYVNVFDSKKHYCHEVIFTLLPTISEMVKDECVLHPDTIRKLVFSPLTNDSGIQELENLYLNYEKSAWHLKTVVADGRELGEEIPIVNAKPNATVSGPANSLLYEEMNYQKKINPWKLLSVSEEIEEYYGFNKKRKCLSDDGLVVVASLLEHLPNLGGLCRTCEIFGVSKFVVNTLKVINDQHFLSLSVSSQNWVNLLEVPIRDLVTFLQTYAAKGYAILGVEQANESSSLTDFTFPKKSVLLLGNERQGIPRELLHLVDYCIEIPQVGITRSLNVHVTGALCIWQYASQHCFV